MTDARATIEAAQCREIAEHMLAQFGAKAPQIVAGWAANHARDGEPEGAQMWQRVANLAAKLLDQTDLRTRRYRRRN